jgi:hypothetical protein
MQFEMSLFGKTRILANPGGSATTTAAAAEKSAALAAASVDKGEGGGVGGAKGVGEGVSGGADAAAGALAAPQQPLSTSAGISSQISGSSPGPIDLGAISGKPSLPEGDLPRGRADAHVQLDAPGVATKLPDLPPADLSGEPLL